LTGSFGEEAATKDSCPSSSGEIAVRHMINSSVMSGLSIRSYSLLLIAVTAVAFAACRSGGRSAGPSILGPADQTAEAAELVASANDDLTKIKILYKENEGNREELKNAMEADDAEKVRKIADDVVYLINDGFDEAKSAIDKISRAQEMEINEDYREYLRLKEESLKKELDAFENYRQAARTLRDNYDPKNAAMRDKVKADFKTRVENYRELMEDARVLSNRANDLAKEAIRRQQDK
jgi:vacuolar-type H+-ATPase subunit I/STV1